MFYLVSKIKVVFSTKSFAPNWFELKTYSFIPNQTKQQLHLIIWFLVYPKVVYI